jgi:cyclopropane fatty-acyl-phospholipid synthase-like methyltransferase
MAALSPRLAGIVAALPLRPGLRVLEIGCGPGAMAREMARRVHPGAVLGIDRSAKAIAQALSAGDVPGLSFRCTAVEALALEDAEAPFDLAVAIRVGVLDGRHPEGEARALARIAAALVPGGLLYIGEAAPLRAVRPEA